MGRLCRAMSHLLLTRPLPARADTARERVRLWWVQSLMSAAWGAATAALVWLAVVLGGGPVGAAAVLAAGLAPLALSTAGTAWLVARAPRRALLVAAPALAAVALIVCGVAADRAGVAAVAVCAAALGLARAVFDGATADVLHHLTTPERRADACRDLTARFGAGNAAGVAAALAIGVAGGPRAGVLLGGVLAATAAGVAAGHHPDLGIRVAGRPPLGHALRAAVDTARRQPLLRRSLVAGAVGIAVGAAQATVLIAWLKDGVGLREALPPTLLAGFAAVRLLRPLIVRHAQRRRPAALLATALGVQAAASLTAYAAHDSIAGAAAYGLSLGAAIFLGVLITRTLRDAVPAELAPVVGLAAGAAWALAGCVGAGAGALLATGAGIADTHLVLAAAALAGAAALTGRVVLTSGRCRTA